MEKKVVRPDEYEDEYIMEGELWRDLLDYCYEDKAVSPVSAEKLREWESKVRQISSDASTIRDDWSDPRYECREIVKLCAELQKELLAAAESMEVKK